MGSRAAKARQKLIEGTISFFTKMKQSTMFGDLQHRAASKKRAKGCPDSVLQMPDKAFGLHTHPFQDAGIKTDILKCRILKYLRVPNLSSFLKTVWISTPRGMLE